MMVTLVVLYYVQLCIYCVEIKYLLKYQISVQVHVLICYKFSFCCLSTPKM